MLKNVLFALILLSCIGCYRMPTDEDYSLVPTINNPSVTYEKPNRSVLPGVGY